VADLARGPADTVLKPAAGDQARADARGDLQIGEVRAPAPGAPNELGESPEVRVVFDLDGEPEPPARLPGGVDADPSGEDRRGLDGARGPVDRGRQAHPDADHAVAIDLRLGEDVVDERGGGVKAFVRGVIDVELAPGLRENGVGQVRDGDPQVAVAEVDSDGEARLAVERDHHRRTPRVGLTVDAGLPLAREVRFDQVGNDRRHR
jgi:hypothetical protein